MIDKKINETINILIKKIKDNNLGSIKLSNKLNTIEITNSTESHNTVQNTQNILPSNNQINKAEMNDNFISIDSPMVGIVYLTLNQVLLHLPKKVKRLKKVILSV